MFISDLDQVTFSVNIDMVNRNMRSMDAPNGFECWLESNEIEAGMLWLFLT